MPAGVSTFTYVKFATAALLSMLAGEHLPAPLFHLKKNFSLYNLWGGGIKVKGNVLAALGVEKESGTLADIIYFL